MAQLIGFAEPSSKKIVFTFSIMAAKCLHMPSSISSSLHRLTSAGDTLYSGDELLRINRLQNIVILSFIILHTVQLIATISLGLYLLMWDFPNFYMSLWWYVVPPVLAVIMDSYFLRRKLREQWGAAWDFALQCVYLVGIGIVSSLMGFHAGFWFFLIPALVNPFMIYQGNLRRRLAWFVFNLAAAAIIILLGVCYPALLPLPHKITTVVFQLIAAVFAVAAVVTAIVVWRRMDLTARFFSFWKKWSYRGAHLFEEENARKYRIIQNQLILIFALLATYMLGVTLYLMAGYADMPSKVFWPLFLNYVILTLAEILILISCMISSKYSKRITPVTVALASGGIFVGYMGISLQKDSLFYLYNLALLPLPFIMYSMKTATERFITGIAVCYFGIQIIGSHYFLTRFQPLRPLPIVGDALLVSYLAIAGLVVAFIAAFFYTSRQSKATELILEMERKNLALERKKSDDLLLNILPAEVAQELKEKGHTEPILFQSASVVFTDFVGFTKIAEHLPPEELVAELDKCFSYFDSVCARYNLEKLKTIGDAFMAAGGIPKPNHTLAVDCCLAALEIQSFMKQMKTLKESLGFPYWELRLGINTGNLVAGVVGEKKFAYDVWGDTVNTASRMESSGLAGMINISGATFEQVKLLFECEPRGKVKAKNKGEIDMYFLHRIKPEFTSDSVGNVPNATFDSLYQEIANGTQLITALRA